MDHRDRLERALRGDRPDHVPVALWRHFPGDDQRPETLARAHVAFYRAFDLDLLKVTPASGYYGDDWGLRAGYRPNREGVRHYTDRPIKKASDWERLKRLDPSHGTYGREVQAIRLIAEEVGADVHVIETVFSPLTIARTLSGEQAVVRYLRETPDALHRGLEIITEVTADFVRAVLAAGADGVFFATQMATTDALTVEEYEEFGRLRPAGPGGGPGGTRRPSHPRGERHVRRPDGLPRAGDQLARPRDPADPRRGAGSRACVPG